MRRKIQQEEERMRGVETRIQEIRHAIFTEVAKMAYDVDSPVEKDDRGNSLPCNSR